MVGLAITLVASGYYIQICKRGLEVYCTRRTTALDIPFKNHQFYDFHYASVAAVLAAF
jgi:hypothetical protein